MCLALATLLAATQPTEYVSSANERRWLAGDARGNICSLASSPRELSGWRQAIDYASRRCGHFHVADPDRCSPSQAAAHARPNGGVLSRFVRADGSHTSIEPLSGIGMHPFANTGCSLNATDIGGGPRPTLGNLSHLIPASRCDDTPSDSKPRRALLYDLGCSVYGDAAHCTRRARRGIGVCAGVATGYGPSIPALLGLYRQRGCLEFDAIYGEPGVHEAPSSAQQHLHAAPWPLRGRPYRGALVHSGSVVASGSRPGEAGSREAVAHPRCPIVCVCAPQAGRRPSCRATRGGRACRST